MARDMKNAQRRTLLGHPWLWKTGFLVLEYGSMEAGGTFCTELSVAEWTEARSLTTSCLFSVDGSVINALGLAHISV